MVDINTTIQFIEPITAPIRHVATLVQVLAGGFVGLFILSIIQRHFEFRSIKKQLSKIESDIQSLKSKRVSKKKK